MDLSETVQRHARYSPSWSFRRDNRGRVAGEEIPANWLHGGGGGNSRVDVKSGTPVETAFASDEGSPLDSFRTPAWQNHPAVTGGNTMVLRFPSSGRLCKSGESKKVSTTDDEEMKSWGQLRKERILKVKTNDYGIHDPPPVLVKPPIKLPPH